MYGYLHFYQLTFSFQMAETLPLVLEEQIPSTEKNECIKMSFNNIGKALKKYFQFPLI